MRENSTDIVDQEGVIAAIRKVVGAADGKRVTRREFLKQSGLRPEDVARNFAGWEEALTAAGCRMRRHNAFIEDAALLEDWGSVARKFMRVPTHAEYKVHGNFSTRTLDVRFGGWRNLPKVFDAFAKGRAEWADLPALEGQRKKEALPYRTGKGRRIAATKWRTRRNRHMLSDAMRYGARLDSAVLQHAPTNENGVVFLFGAMAEKLGFVVEAMSTKYPDCEAKRLVGPDLWERVRIEFEYESRNFKHHGHPAEGCDLIVCWTHNWPECPLEVVTLKNEMGQGL